MYNADQMTDSAIVCDKCLLRAPAAADVASIAKHANDRDIWINLRDMFPHPYAIENARWYVEHVADQQPRLQFVIDVAGEACGTIGLVLGEDIQRCSAEVGYWVGRRHWNRGIATSAVRGLCEYGFKALGLHRIFATVIVWNSPSFRVLEKAGFQREGVLRNACVKEGRVLDMAMYARVTGP